MPNTEKYELIQICGQKALFIDGRIDESTLPNGMYRYDLREGDGINTYFGSIEPDVLVNFAGSIITREPIDFGTDSYIELEYDTEPNFLGEDMTIAEFAQFGGNDHENP